MQTTPNATNVITKINLKTDSKYGSNSFEIIYKWDIHMYATYNSAVTELYVQSSKL